VQGVKAYDSNDEECVNVGRMLLLFFHNIDLMMLPSGLILIELFCGN